MEKRSIKDLLRSRSFIDQVCLSYRHDFGLLDQPAQTVIRGECNAWMEAIANNLPDDPLPSQEALNPLDLAKKFREWHVKTMKCYEDMMTMNLPNTASCLWSMAKAYEECALLVEKSIAEE